MEGAEERGHVWGNKRNTGFRRKESGGVGAAEVAEVAEVEEVAGRWKEKVQ